MRFSFKVNGQPKPQPRPRAFVRGGRASVYNPDSAKEWKNAVRYAVHGLINKPISRPVNVCLEFYMPRPKSHYRSGKFSHVLKDSAPRRHVKTPDVDNLAKAVLDALTNANAWVDDAQVVTLLVTKQWDDLTESGCLISIRPIEDE